VLAAISVESFEDGLTVRFELLDAEGVTDLELLRCFALHQSYRAHRHAPIDESLHEQNLDEIDEREKFVRSRRARDGRADSTDADRPLDFCSGTFDPTGECEVHSAR